MKPCLICAGLVAAFLGGDFGEMLTRAQAQVAVPPANPNGLTPQQMQRMRRMMRLRRHHRHRRKIKTTPATSMMQNQMLQNQIPGAIAGQNPVAANPANDNPGAGKLTAQRKKQIAARLRQASF